jgi:hypothetical protein
LVISLSSRSVYNDSSKSEIALTGSEYRRYIVDCAPTKAMSYLAGTSFPFKLSVNLLFWIAYNALNKKKFLFYFILYNESSSVKPKVSLNVLGSIYSKGIVSTLYLSIVTLLEVKPIILSFSVISPL